MYVIDRTVAIVHPKQPFLEWLNSISDVEHAHTIEQAGRECLTFLMPRYVTQDDAEEALKHLYEGILTVQLSMGCTDETRWPVDMSYDMFRRWFDVEFHSMVIDPFENPIQKEPYEYVSTTHLPPRG